MEIFDQQKKIMLQKHLRDEKETIMCVCAIPCARAPLRAFGARYFGRVHSPVWVGKIKLY